MEVELVMLEKSSTFSDLSMFPAFGQLTMLSQHLLLSFDDFKALDLWLIVQYFDVIGWSSIKSLKIFDEEFDGR